MNEEPDIEEMKKALKDMKSFEGVYILPYEEEEISKVIDNLLTILAYKHRIPKDHIRIFFEVMKE